MPSRNGTCKLQVLAPVFALWARINSLFGWLIRWGSEIAALGLFSIALTLNQSYEFGLADFFFVACSLVVLAKFQWKIKQISWLQFRPITGWTLWILGVLLVILFSLVCIQWVNTQRAGKPWTKVFDIDSKQNVHSPTASPAIDMPLSTLSVANTIVVPQVQSESDLSYDKGKGYIDNAKSTLDIELGVLEFQKAIALDPKNVKVYLALAEAYSDTEKHDEEKKMYKKALALFPKDCTVYSELEKMDNLIYEDIFSAQEQIDILQHSVQYNCADSTTYFDLGLELESTGRNKEALNAYKKSLKMNWSLTVEKRYSDLMQKVVNSSPVEAR